MLELDISLKQGSYQDMGPVLPCANGRPNVDTCDPTNPEAKQRVPCKVSIHLILIQNAIFIFCRCSARAPDGLRGDKMFKPILFPPLPEVMGSRSEVLALPSDVGTKELVCCFTTWWYDHYN
jgi:hypothetical protein